MLNSIKKNRFFTFFKETEAELKKTNWPSKDEVIRYTWVVLVLSFFLMIVLGGMDYLFNYLAEKFIL